MRSLRCLSPRILILLLLLAGLPGTATAAPIVSVRVESLGPAGASFESGLGVIDEFLSDPSPLFFLGSLAYDDLLGELTLSMDPFGCDFDCAGFDVILRAEFPTPSIASATTVLDAGAPNGGTVTLNGQPVPLVAGMASATVGPTVPDPANLFEAVLRVEGPFLVEGNTSGGGLFGTLSVTFEQTSQVPVPEPATLFLVVGGAGALAARRARLRRSSRLTSAPRPRS